MIFWVSQKAGFFSIDNYFSDLLYQLKYQFHSEDIKNNNIVIVDIDNKSAWIVDRPDYFADIVKTIAEKGQAEVIGIDILFNEFKNPEPPEKDMKDIALECPYKADKHPAEMKLACTLQDDDVSNVVLAVHSKNTDEKGYSLIFPLNILRETAMANGYVQIVKDKDAISRRTLLMVENPGDNKLVYSMPMLMAMFVVEKIPEIINKNTIKFNDHYISRNSKANEFFDIYPVLLGPNKIFKYIPLSEIREKINDEKFLKKEFEGKIVFIGSSDEEFHDLKWTPFTRFNMNKSFEGLMPGVEFHANTLYSILNNKFYSHIPFWLNFVFAFVVIAISVIIMLRIKTLYAVLINFGLIALTVFASYMLFIDKLIILTSLGSVILTALIAIPVSYGYKYLVEKYERKLVEQDKAKLMNLFDRYVSPDVAELIWQNKDQIILSGEKKVATVLFSDIRGFTTLSENADPQDILTLLNDYFEKMSHIIYANNGNLNKFIGDGLMVLYGVPVSSGSPEEDACNAVKSAVEMIKAVHQLNNELKDKYNEINIGIGIHTGEIIVGNIGSSKRMEYSALGDTVNLASRLESANKEFRTNIIVSAETYDLVKDTFALKYLSSTKVKGRTKEVNIYTLNVDSQEE